MQSLKEQIEKVKSISDNKNLLTNLISLELVENYENALIVKENEDIKKMYWSRNGRLRISDKAEHGVFIWAINECKKYGSWMTLKGDNIGFRGQYQRGDVQIFLNKEVFGDVITLEPIHKLIEQATFEDMNKRISIHQCIDYLELQRNLLDERERELLSNELVSRLLYDEHSKMIIERTKPDELIYEDKGTIFSMLRGVIPISKIMVKSLNDE